MMPEINARDERKAQWQDRRDRRKQRRDERQQRRDDRGGPQGQVSKATASRPQRGQQGRWSPARAAADVPRQPAAAGQRRASRRPAAATTARAGNAPRESRPNLQMPLTHVDHDVLARVGTPLGDAAAAVFAQLRNGQPLPVRQLAAMMRKRNLVNQDPEQLWPQLKAELLGDERSYRTLGLRPRIVYRGRDLFAPGPVAMTPTADAEAGVATRAVEARRRDASRARRSGSRRRARPGSSG